jgi:hypothetical protein
MNCWDCGSEASTDGTRHTDNGLCAFCLETHARYSTRQSSLAHYRQALADLVQLAQRHWYKTVGLVRRQ